MIPRYVANFATDSLDQDCVQFLIIGSGIAGLYTALVAAQQGMEVLLITKERLRDCNTEYAQGGIAAVMDRGDSPQLHLEDTVTAGAGLCDPLAVEILVNEGPERIRELIELGVPFDRKGGHLSLTQEGAHSRRRILHAGGDATGQVVWRVMEGAVRSQPHLTLCENVSLVDLLIDAGQCRGALVYDGNQGELRVIWAGVTLLATGGSGQVYEHTTNPDVATGDGVAVAFRAGAEIADLEFVQFHPTTLNHPQSRGFLISEAVRGEGGLLRDGNGERFMLKYHPQAELAPRDVVARAIYAQWQGAKPGGAFLDVTGMGKAYLAQRFPTIYKTLRHLGIEPGKEYIPVTPAAHYLMGGIRVDHWGATSIPGLYACGEVACNGVHGANRLASNSLVDGLVFGYRAVHRVVQGGMPQPSRLKLASAELQPATTVVDYKAIRQQLRSLMERCGGIIRNAPDLERGLQQLNQMEVFLQGDVGEKDNYEVKNMLIVSRLILLFSLRRTESRGAHYRSDFPDAQEEWSRQQVLTIKEVQAGVEHALN